MNFNMVVIPVQRQAEGTHGCCRESRCNGKERVPSRWRDFALKVKKDVIKRPAFQEEFPGTVPGWEALK